MEIVKHFNGHSGANIKLCKKHNKYFVVKDNYKNAKKSVDILSNIPFPTPEVYKVTDSEIVMEYLNCQDMSQYIETADNNKILKLVDFISSYIEYCLENSRTYNFSYEIEIKKNTLSKYYLPKWIDFDSTMPKSIIHGDLTLENILYANNRFYFIDANPTNLNSIKFDVNKLQQDIKCLWFVRNKKNNIHYKINCNKIRHELYSRYPSLFDNNIAAFMLARILPYTTNKVTWDFLVKEIDNYGNNHSMRW